MDIGWEATFSFLAYNQVHKIANVYEYADKM